MAGPAQSTRSAKSSASNTRPVVHIVSQAHLDPVWLWRWREGFAEALTTLHSAVDRLHEVPALRYTCSAAAVYRWVLQTDPRLFAKIVALVRAGRWEVVGGWVVQADTNLPSELALRRQALLAKAWLHEHLGVNQVDIGYCVDSFGHSAGLPSILASTGFKYYVFARPHLWNRPDLPDLFWWEGPDGARVLALRLPTSYCQPPGTNADDMEAIFRKEWRQTLLANSPLGVWFLGIGNHGGGPAREHVMRMRALQKSKDVALPSMAFSTLREFFSAMERSSEMKTLPVIRGELLHEFRGCYSANARFKRLYRRTEHELLAAERLLLSQSNSSADLGTAALGGALPPPALLDAWWTLSFNQFHDILPGTSIASAYEDARDELGAVRDCARKISTTVTHTLARRCDTRSAREGTVFVLNSLPHARVVVVSFDTFVSPHGDSPITHLSDQAGGRIPVQWSAAEALYGPHLKEWRRLVATFRVPAGGSRWLNLAHGVVRKAVLRKIKKPRLARLVKSVRFISVADKVDTWGYHTHKWDELIGIAKVTREKVIDNGVVFRRIRRWLTLGKSTMILDVTEWHDLQVIELHVRVSWHDREQALKLQLDLPKDCGAFRAKTPGAVVARPLDAKEWPCLDWVAIDTLKNDLAVMIANDGLFAYDATPERLRFTLLRCVPHALHDPIPFDADSPEPFLDEGWHEYRLWLAEIAGDTDSARLEQVAMDLVTPVELMVDSAHRGAAKR